MKRTLTAAPLVLPADLGGAVAPRFHTDLRFVSEEEMRELNRDYRGKDRPTDVLSFALLEGEPMPVMAPEAGVALGDIVISLETAATQARERSHALGVEIAFLAIHGTLHLLGYDHQTPAQRRRMFALQDGIWAQAG